MRFILTGIVIAAYLLHQGLWFWRTARPLVFGFLPIGLFAAFCLLCSAVMIVLVKFAGRSFDEAASALLPEDEAVDTALFVFTYLAVVLYVGIFAFRRSSRRESAEDYFLASRSLGTAVFIFSLFGTNMTAFTILGSSGHAFSNGIVTFGLMASASALIIPLTLFLIGTRLWALGKRFGFMTPVQFFGAAGCGHIGTVIFAVQAVCWFPHHHRRHGWRCNLVGHQRRLGALLAGVRWWLVVMGYVFFGGMRGTAW
jgi:SSS family solute:Na+ symporter